MKLIFVSAVLFGLATHAGSDERRKSYPELFELSMRAQSTQPEFAAGTLLRVAASEKIADRGWKIELVEEAFRLAGAARNAVRARTVHPEQVLMYGFGNGLDRLTLESFAVRQMLTLDQKKARGLFFQMRIPQLEKAQCAAATISDPTEYYSTLTLIANRTFDKDRRAQDDRLSFLMKVVGSVQSAVELSPLLASLSSMDLMPDHRRVLTSLIPGVLDRLNGDDQAFTFAMQDIDKQIALLEKSPGGGDPLLQAYRAYLVRFFTAARCSAQSMTEDTQALVRGFNSRYVNASHPSLAPIGENETKPSKLIEAAKPAPVFSGAGAEEGKRQFMHLMFGDGSRSLNDGDKSKQSWQDEFQIYFRAIPDSKPESGESAQNFFLRKSGMLSGAITVVPAGTEREKTIGLYITYLSNDDMQRENFVVWLHEVEQIATLTKSIRPADHKHFLDALERSGHPVLSLYAMRERLLPPIRTWVN